MRRVGITVVLLIMPMLFTILNAAAEEKFQKLSGSQIRAKVPAMEITDGVHWADVFAPNGTLTSYSMSRKIVGKWRVSNDEVCLDRTKG